MTQVRLGGGSTGDVVAFFEGGSYSSIAVRKAAAITRMDDEATLPLVNVQTGNGSEETDTLMKQGQETIDEAARSVGVEKYEAEAVVTDDIESELAGIAKGHGTICLGVSRVSSVDRILSGAIPETIGEQVSGTIVLVRSGDRTNRSLRSAVQRRLSA